MIGNQSGDSRVHGIIGWTAVACAACALTAGSVKALLGVVTRVLERTASEVRVRDMRSGRICTLLTSARRRVVTWKDEPGSVEEVKQERWSDFEWYADGLVVERDAGREGRTDGTIERLRVKWDGQRDIHVMDVTRLSDFVSLGTGMRS